MCLKKPILFFDGHCTLCNSFINFIMKFNRGQFYIASIQGQTAKEKLSQKDIQDLSSLIFLDNEVKYFKSDAVFRVCLKLGGGFHLISFFKFIPRPIAERLYDWVAKNRYNWFGKKEVCRLPSEAEKALFLE